MATAKQPKRKGPAPGTGGRPRKELNWDAFEALARANCTVEEVAAVMECDADTIQARCKERFGATFSAVLEQKACIGTAALRRKQMQIALGGNVTMLIWLGKQKLGQKDRHFAEVSRAEVEWVDELGTDEG